MKAIGYPASVDWFGADNRDQGQLVFWIRVDTDQEKEKLEGYPGFWDKLRTYLKRFGYPKEGRDAVVFGIESQETIRRQAERKSLSPTRCLVAGAEPGIPKLPLNDGNGGLRPKLRTSEVNGLPGIEARN